jgi:hypothetical protein
MVEYFELRRVPLGGTARGKQNQDHVAALLLF